MKTYHVILKCGHSRYVLAEGYEDTGEKLVFHVGQQFTDEFERSTVLKLDELGETANFLRSLPIEVLMAVPFQ